jgi:hypothetical protein
MRATIVYCRRVQQYQRAFFFKYIPSEIYNVKNNIKSIYEKVIAYIILSEIYEINIEMDSINIRNKIKIANAIHIF